MSLKVLHSMLETALWKRLNLIIHFIDPKILAFFQSLSINSKNNDNQQINKCVLNTHVELDVMHKPIDVEEDDNMEIHLNNPVCCICKKSRYLDMSQAIRACTFTGDSISESGAAASSTDKVRSIKSFHNFN